MSVWDDIADTTEEAENLKVRAQFMRAIRAQVDSFGWSQAVAVENLGLTQPRVSALFRGKISEFSLDALVTIGAKVGVHAEVSTGSAPLSEGVGDELAVLAEQHQVSVNQVVASLVRTALKNPDILSAEVVNSPFAPPAVFPKLPPAKRAAPEKTPAKKVAAKRAARAR